MTKNNNQCLTTSQADSSACDFIDVVIPWVDGTDPAWLEERKKYDNIYSPDKSESRYRNWDNLQFILRAIEQCWPWVHNVFLITWGHVPSWINKSNPKLRIVTHADYIPAKYLPTFSSHVIELNLHRIPELSEKFIYMNDDFYPIRDMRASDFFRDNLPCDCALQQHLLSIYVPSDDTIRYIDFNNLSLLNAHFRKPLVTKGNLLRWYGPSLGLHGIIQALNKSTQQFFTGFRTHHSAQPFLKSTFERVWNSVYDYLDNECQHKFRQITDVNQWLIRYWQLAENRFYPTQPLNCFYFSLPACNPGDITSAILNRTYDIITINDTPLLSYSDFQKAKVEINKALENLFPRKSSFEL